MYENSPFSSIYVLNSESDIVIADKFSQWWIAASSNVVTLSGISIVSITSLLTKASSPIVVTFEPSILSGIMMFVSLPK